MGKFITHDNDYFYQPAVAFIYIIFIFIIISVRFIHKRQVYSEEEFLINALRKMEEVASDNLNEDEKNVALSYLKKTNPEDPLAISLKNLLTRTDVVPPPHPSYFVRIKNNLRNFYYKITQIPVFPVALILFFTIQLLIKLGYVIVLIFFKGLGLEQILNIQIFSILALRLEDLTFIEWAKFFSSLLSGVFVLLGIINIYRSRLMALKMFERSILVSIFLTQVFIFYEEQFVALFGLSFNLLILVALRYMIHKESSRDVYR